MYTLYCIIFYFILSTCITDFLIKLNVLHFRCYIVLYEVYTIRKITKLPANKMYFLPNNMIIDKSCTSIKIIVQYSYR